ncbi:DUF1007 family protein [Methylobacterium nonmethylotrophicum]|uniref:DUF1007 family protein n=1 Tax=Methylobacterium nonmethylotrophicum TaxID=1141884 RepID=A0A4Z0NFW5_9HYPH|nr:DUF1007 family protein [Methylobacterium nonmethylotrophicum]TGD95078.1 DUF1007 family protein [Methylobacterium nonmethylotrophicum]
MLRPSRLPILLAGIALAAATPALAHPHVWITTRVELDYGPDGALRAIRHAWTFDPTYSAFAVQGLGQSPTGPANPTALAALARDNTDNLAEQGYFTLLKVNGRKQDLGAAADPAMTFADGQLTLRFTLPLKAPVAGTASLEVYDPTYFVAFSLADGEGVATLAGAPSGCRATAHRPKSAPPATAATGMSEAFFEAMTAASSYGVQFANRIVVAC